jgi:hypothetical protein
MYSRIEYARQKQVKTTKIAKITAELFKIMPESKLI